MRIYCLNVHRAPYFKQRWIYSTTEGCIILFIEKYIKIEQKCLFIGLFEAYEG